MIDYLKPVVAFDVDNTLVDNEEEPRSEVVQLFRLLQRFGCEMVVWSNGGGENEASIDYALRICKKLGLEARVVEKGSFQPDITVDDLDMFTRVSERIVGKVNIRV